MLISHLDLAVLSTCSKALQNRGYKSMRYIVVAASAAVVGGVIGGALYITHDVRALFGLIAFIPVNWMFQSALGKK
jgi:hypothetical protein